jgi:NAD-dependent deacetylase
VTADVDGSLDATIERARALLAADSRVVVLTGAGVSAESGVPTFREALDGYWSRYRPEELATPQAFHADPVKVWSWYGERRERVQECRPNPAHHAIARFVLGDPDTRVLYTQNVDGLHTRALLEAVGNPPHDALPRTLHGDLLDLSCVRCAWRERDRTPIDATDSTTLPRCRACGALARPAVIWFGEMLDPELLEAAFHDAWRADVCLVVGTSALVHPAATLPRVTHAEGGVVIEVNPAETPLTPLAAVRVPAPAAHVVPRLLD